MLDIRRDIYALDTFSDEDAKQINKEIVRELAYKIMRIRDNLTNEFKMFCNSIDIEFLDDIERYIYNGSEPILYYHDEPKPTSEYRHNFCGLHYSVARGQFVSGYPCYYWELKPIVFSNKDNQTIIELKFLYDTIIPGKTPIELFVKNVSLNMQVRKVRMHVNTVVLKYGDDYRDCARIRNKDDSLNGMEAKEEKYSDYYSFSKDVDEYSFQAAWQAVDPRVNHYPIDWTLKLSKPTKTEYPGTMGKKNTFDGYIDNKQPYINATTDGDKEAVSDPAWTSSGHLASAYIRHAPMESLWELGCISRAEPWKTLNLKKSRVFASGETQGGGEYAKGDANILDQVTLTDKKSRFGLINLNTDEHFVLETLFYQIPFHTELHQAGIGADDKSILGATGTPSIYPVYSKKDTSNHKEESCLACLIMERSKILRFEKRSDLLMDETEVDALTTIDSGKRSSLKETVTKLRTALFSIPKTGESASPEEETSSKTTDAEEEQLVGKIMNLVAADPYETVYIIAVGQSIRDIGSSDKNGITIFKNWAGSGKADKTYKDNAVTKGNDAYKAYRRAGYIRPSTLKEIEDGDSSPKVLNGAPNQLEDEITGVKKGQYDLGADKISAESKIVMTLCFDPWTKKWKIKRFEYVE